MQTWKYKGGLCNFVQNFWKTEQIKREKTEIRDHKCSKQSNNKNKSRWLTCDKLTSEQIKEDCFCVYSLTSISEIVRNRKTAKQTQFLVCKDFTKIK